MCVCVCEKQAGVYVCEMGRGVCVCVIWEGECTMSGCVCVNGQLYVCV